jgi:hypothetical protein
MKREKTQIIKIRNAKRKITRNTTGILEHIRDHLESQFFNKFENFEEMDRLLDIYGYSKQKKQDINHLNRSITENKIEATIESPKKQKSRT